MSEMSDLDREVAPQGNATDKIPWYGVYRRPLSILSHPNYDSGPALLDSPSGTVFAL